MPAKLKFLIIPAIIVIFLSLGKQSNSVGQNASNSLYLPLLSYGTSKWIGPYGGTIVAAAADPIDPNIVYVGTFGSGVYKSINGGQYWSSVSWDLANLEVYSLAIDPKKPWILYAGTYHNQVYKSVDGGNTWSWSGTGMQNPAIVYSLAIDPVNPSIIYAATRGESNNGFPPWNGILYKSSNGGQTWQPSLENVGGIGVKDWAYSVTVNPNQHEQVFAALHENNAFRSDNSGATWGVVNTGINDPSGRSIIISPQPDYASTLYYGVWHYDSVYRTINGGDLWTGANRGIPNVMVYSMALDPFSADTVYVASFSHGVLKTIDGGRNWGYAGLLPDRLYAIVVNPRKTSNLFVGTLGDGLYASTDFTVSWQRSNTGINNAMVTSVVHSPTDPYLVFASVYGAGVYQSINQGQTWQEINLGLEDKFVHELALDPGNHRLLYALTDTGGMYRNDLNSSKGWVKIGIGLPLSDTSDPAYPADHPNASLDMKEDFAESEGHIDSVTMTNENLLTMIYAPSNPSIVYLGTGGSGVYQSTNGGLNWYPAELGGQSVYDLAVDTSDPNLVYAATNTPG
ncbi:MAG: hypothetical protein FIA98_06745, partial [Anaerolineae bacterium]|nr:hypothetical protein [Anaerolineae bacterium]